MRAGTFDIHRVNMEFVFEDGSQHRTTPWARAEGGLRVDTAIEPRERSGGTHDAGLRALIARQ